MSTHRNLATARDRLLNACDALLIADHLRNSLQSGTDRVNEAIDEMMGAAKLLGFALVPRGEAPLCGIGMTDKDAPLPKFVMADCERGTARSDETAALAESGYMPLSEYVRTCTDGPLPVTEAPGWDSRSFVNANIKAEV